MRRSKNAVEVFPMYSEIFVRKCSVRTASYTFVRNNCADTGCDDHTDYGYNDRSCSDYSKYSDYSEAQYYDACGSGGGGYSSYYRGSCSDYSRTTGCSDHSRSGYNNHSDYKNCYVKWSYTNYADASNSSTGVPINFSWSSKWGPSGLTEVYLKNSLDELQEIQNNIKTLLAKKGRNSVPNTSTDNFDTSLTPPQNVLGSQRDALSNSINSLYQNLLNRSANLTKNDFVKVSEINAIKQAVDDLAKMNINYKNYVDSNWSPDAGSLPTEKIPASIIQGTTPAAPYKDNYETRYN